MDDLVLPDRFPRSSTYDSAWVLSMDMGPHPLWKLEELLDDVQLRSGDRVLDLGCGRGATSVFLAREFGVDVVALDKWADPEERRAVLDAAGVGDRVTVRKADVRAMPVEDEGFDAVVCIDAFEYFGTDVHLLPQLLRVLRPGGWIGMSTPALSVDPYDQTPPTPVTALVGWEAAAWHAPDWWRRHWELTGLVENVRARMQHSSREHWIRWARASGESEDGALLTMLNSIVGDGIGFALVSAIKGAGRVRD